MKSKLINWKQLESLNNYSSNEDNDNFLIKRDKIHDDIQFHLFSNTYNFDFSGVKIIQCLNTNKFLRQLFDDYGESLISINGNKICIKNIIIISPLTRISDIVNTKSSGDINKYLRYNRDIGQDVKKISNIISEIYNSQDECLKNITNIDLVKTELINYLDIKEDFIDHNNINDILNILKSNMTRKLIIFNDVDYVSLNECEKWLENFDFLYIMNNYEKNWEQINNYDDFLLIFDGEKLLELDFWKS